MKKHVIFLLVAAVVLFAVMERENAQQAEQENAQQEEQENAQQEDDSLKEREEISRFRSNILDDHEKRAEAEAFILTVEGELLEKAYSSGTEMLYYDPESLCAYVDDALTNHYGGVEVFYAPEDDAEETRELFQNHAYSVMLEYIAEYDPNRFTIVDGTEGRLRVKIEYRVVERDGVWEIYKEQYRGFVPVEETDDSELSC